MASSKQVNSWSISVCIIIFEARKHRAVSTKVSIDSGGPAWGKSEQLVFNRL